jgi:hypothetical protein
MLVVIEIKGTAWDAIPADRVMWNLRQLQAYLDTAIEDMEAASGRASLVRCCTQAAPPAPRRWR